MRDVRVEKLRKYFAIIVTAIVLLGTNLYAELVMDSTCYKLNMTTFVYDEVECPDVISPSDNIVVENSDSLMFSELLRYSLYAQHNVGTALEIDGNFNKLGSCDPDNDMPDPTVVNANECAGVNTASFYVVGDQKFDARIGTNGDAEIRARTRLGGALTVRGDAYLGSGDKGVFFMDTTWIMGNANILDKKLETIAPFYVTGNLAMSSNGGAYSTGYVFGDVVKVGGDVSVKDYTRFKDSLYYVGSLSKGTHFDDSANTQVANEDSLHVVKPSGYYVDGWVPQLDIPKANIRTTDIDYIPTGSILAWSRANHDNISTVSLTSAYNNGDILQEYCKDATGTMLPASTCLTNWFNEYGSDVLPPGHYGDFGGKADANIILGEGKYYFSSLNLEESWLKYKQPNGGRTEVYIEDTFRINGQKADITPFDATSLGGTALFYIQNATSFDFYQGNDYYGTFLAPNAHVTLKDNPKLFGQIFAKTIYISTGFNGNAGKFIPYDSDKPTITLATSRETQLIEGDSLFKIFEVPFELTHINGLGVTVYFHVKTESGLHNATVGEDYESIGTGNKAQITIPAGSLSDTFDIKIFGDLDYENNETFTVIIDSAKNADLESNPTYAMTIMNNDDPPNVTFDLSALTVDEGDGSVNLPVSLSGSTTIPGTVVIKVKNPTTATATENSDFTLSSVTIPAGETQANVKINLIDDLLDEPVENLQIVITVNSNFSVGADSLMAITIEDNDDPIGLSEDMKFAYNVIEGNLITITVELADISGQEVSFKYQLKTSSTASPSDITLDPEASNVITIEPGYTSAVFTLFAVDDVLDELAENAVIELYDANNLDLGTSKEIVVTILENDSPIAVDAEFYIDENPANNVLVGTLEKSGPNPSSYEFSYTGTHSDKISVAADGKITIKDPSAFDYETNKSISFVVDLVGPNHTDQANVIININDVSEPPILTGDDTTYVTVTENVGSVNIPINLEFPSDRVLTIVTFSEGINSTLSATDDYSFSSEILEIPYLETSGSIDVIITDDVLDEPTEVLYVEITLVDPAPGSRSKIYYKIMVEDDDGPVSLSDAMKTEYTIEEGDSKDIEIRLENISGQDIQFDYEIDFANSIIDSDDIPSIGGTITIPAGEFSTKISVSAIDDILDELDESFVLKLTNPKNVDLADKGEITITIKENDSPIGVDTTISFEESPLTPNGTVLVKLRKDGPDTSSYTFSMPTTSAFSDKFSLSPDGVLILIDSDENVFDYEKRRSFDLNVQIDGLYHSDIVYITVNLIDAPEDPIWNNTDTVFVKENTLSGYPVNTVDVSPGYGGKEGMSYEIISGSGVGIFVIDPKTGIISVAPFVELDYETENYYEIEIKATNSMGKSVDAVIPISIVDVIEETDVEITVVTGNDSIWDYPDSIWTNADSVIISYEINGSPAIDTTVSNLKTGVNVIIIEGYEPTENIPGYDTLYIYFSDKIPDLEFIDPNDRDTTLVGGVIEEIDPDDEFVYVNDPNEIIYNDVTYVDKYGNVVTEQISNSEDLVEGENIIIREYTDVYGNVGVDTLKVILDTVPPDVDILDPKNTSVHSSYVVDVTWTVDGDTAKAFYNEGLVLGENTIIRFYMDRAGNIGADTVFVKLENPDKSLDVVLENPITEIKDGDLQDYRTENPIREDEIYSLSVVNVETGLENEVLYGSGSKTVNSSRELETNGKHLGPTLIIEVQFPHIGGVNEAGNTRGGTLEELVESLLNSEFGLEEFNGDINKAWDYVLEGTGLSRTSDAANETIWENRFIIELDLYDHLTQWVDKIKIKFDDISKENLDDEGKATFYLTLEPDAELGVRSSTGRSLGSGAYLIRGYARGVAVLKYNTADYDAGYKQVSNKSISKYFGYKRQME